MSGRIHHRGRRVLSATALAAAMTAGWSAAAHAQGGSTSSSGSNPASQVAGETVTANAIGAQFAFNIPGLIPLPDENIIEEDVPFARTLISTGPTVDSRAAPYYPGDILASLGGLESEFLPPEFPNTPYPLMADAQYPPTKAAPSTSTFGGTAPGGLPLSPTVGAGTADASDTGGDATGTVTDLVAGPGMGSGGADLLEAASEQSSDTVAIGASQVTATANSVVRNIEIAGMVDISEITSSASSMSDGTTGTPTASIHLGQVTVDGQQAYIDNQGVHVVGNSTAQPGVPTIAQIQSSLNYTLSQDGITIRLVDPQETTNGAEGIANSGGLLVSVSHNFNAPFINTGALTNNAVQPCIPTQDITEALQQGGGLGDVCLPAGNYTAVTTITLGFATTDVNASVLQNLSVPTVNLGGTGLSTTIPGTTGTGLTSLGSETSLGAVSGPGVTAPFSTSSPGFHLLLKGIPAPLGWVVGGILLCILVAYPMMLAARWQFLVGRR